MRPHLDHDTHTYSLGGRVLPGVTKVLAGLGLLKDLSFLDPFYRERGRAVHACADLYFQGEEIDWGFDGAEHVRPRFERFLRLVEHAKLRPILFEEPLASEVWQYAGTEDYFGPFGDHPFAFLDWKGDGIEPGHRLQVAGGYRGLVYELAQARAIDVDPSDVLHAPCFLVPLGGESLLPRSVLIPDEDGAAMNIFRGAVAVYNWRVAHLGA